MADPSGSVLGAVRLRLLADPAVRLALPGGCHANELPASIDLPYPAAVLRLLKTGFTYTIGGRGVDGSPARRWFERPRVEVWVECLDAERGESAARLAAARLTDAPLPYAPGVCLQGWADDLFLHPDTGRHAAGRKQYSWCLRLDFDLEFSADRATT